MVRRSQRLTPIGLLLGAFCALSAGAEPKAEADKAAKAAKPATGQAAPSAANKAPGTPAADIKAKGAGAQPSTPTPAKDSKADKAEAKADKAEAKADRAELKADKAEAKAGKDSDEHDDKHPGASHGRHGKYKSATAKLRDRYKDGSLKKDELKKQLAALRADRKQRREQHREALKARWGNSLAAPAVREELQHHERRMAHLNRMLLLAETERKGKAKDKLVERIEKLTAKENERHERKMSQLQSAAARSTTAINVPASTTPPVAAPAEPAGKAAVETGAQK